jgi:Na+-dependent transporters of the SNF family
MGKARETWGSKLGFILAVAGSAIGLANIWRFPYLVGTHGGAGFVIVYLAALLLVGFPVLMAEALIGRSTGLSPQGAFMLLGRNSLWRIIGSITVITGFIVSAFYSAVAGWVLGYFVEALRGNLVHFHTIDESGSFFTSLLDSPVFTFGYQVLFLLMSASIVHFGVRQGIEASNKIMLPLLFILLIALAAFGLTLPFASNGLKFLFSPDMSALSPVSWLAALGQAFFTLSLGQGTMVTYGSYLRKEESLVSSCVPSVLMDTVVSLLAGVLIFTTVFSVGLAPDTGPSLIFHTLPLVFSKMWGGFVFAPLFFLLVTFAALTSEISAIEPSVSFLIDRFGWSRSRATWVVTSGLFLLGIPCALSTNLLQHWQFFGMNFLDFLATLASHILIPLGGLAAVLLIVLRWGTAEALLSLETSGKVSPLLKTYLSFSWRYIAPTAIIAIFIHAWFS